MKANTILIETPEKIRFDYKIADIGTRIAAFMIDLLIQFIIILIGYLLLYFSGSLSYFFSSSIGNLMKAFFMLLIFFLRWGYFVFFEITMEGQSPGKKAMRIRVIRENGESLKVEDIFIRNLIRTIDGVPGLPFVGAFVAMIDKKSRRLGDMAAGTLVVNEIHFNLKEPDFQVNIKEESAQNEKIETINKLNENELYIIRRFLNEKHKLPPEKEEEVAVKLMYQIKERLHLNHVELKPIEFLEEVYRQHGHYHKK